MRIAVFTNALSREGGGLFHSVRSLAKTIAGSGHNVSMFAPADAHLDADRAAWGELRTVAYPAWLAHNARAALAQDAPDIIHLNGIWLPHSHIVRVVSQSRDIPSLISPRGMLDGWALDQARFKKKIAGWLYENRNLRGAACMHALCESEYQAIRAFGLKQPVAVIPNGVKAPPPVAERQALPWPFPQAWQGHPVLLFLSRIHPKKGLRPLLHAWHQVAETGAQWRLAIVGPDENAHSKDILTLIEQHGLQASVQWLGPKYAQDRDACYHHASAFILPSYSEGFPMAALEALSFSLPAILTPACHLPEAFDAGAALSTAPAENDIAETLKKLFALEHAQLTEMGQKGECLVNTAFTWDSIARRMIAVYTWLVAPQAHPMPADIRLD
ncbi:MAG: glycosyltransferase [Anaerolineae bacterium]|nr:glycosyltransferase [Anaerolineae bacterium]